VDVVSDSRAVRSSRDDSRGDGPKRTDPATFLRQVVAELRKVVWPTQQQVVTYFIVVMVFVVAMMTIVSLLDLGFGRLAFWLFGNSGTQ
jgi:preprotein translocase subunit SecE